MITYNERSWAIDVISAINLYLSNKDWFFKTAGGENTIKNNRTSLFPDILLFQNTEKSIILNGWELKMPDTPITNSELRENAIKKAKILKRNSFVLWNVTTAVLYVKVDNDFQLYKSWESIDITHRQEVKNKESLWKELLFKILYDLNDFFQNGAISPTTESEILSIGEVIDVVLENVNSTIETIKNKTVQSTRFEAKINQWWRSTSAEYGYKVTQNQYKLQTLSKVILTDWVFKIVFTHILKRHFNDAQKIDVIQTDTIINDGMEIISSISESCNFWNILNPHLAQESISYDAWEQIKALNLFLQTINIAAIDTVILHQLLQNSIVAAKRKVAGQFSTPKKLAELLVRLTIDNKTKTVLDPCCGTGTIIQQAYDLKEEYDLNQQAVLDTIWASDKHSFPIQLATMTMAKPSNIGQIINVFNADVTNLKIGQTIDFKNPNDGSIIQKSLPTIDYVVSNLPFIKNKDLKVENPEIFTINDWIAEQIETEKMLSGKSDIFIYIPFYLYQLLSENGKIGLILSNAWLGTDYGETFLKLLQSFFKIEQVIISGKGKWFDNANVVTTILIAQKRENPNTIINENEVIDFCIINQRLSEIANIKTLSEDIILQESSDLVTINSYENRKIQAFENFGIPWSAYFSNLNWITEIQDKLINANEIFDFVRGERRGWNAMFYPSTGHGIEPQYIQPVLKNLRNTRGLIAAPQTEAFTCSEDISTLGELNHNGALQWIKHFENQVNGSNQPLPEVLRKPNLHWYEMKTDTMADFVANLNYDKSLFIAQLENRAFIDQRLIGILVKEAYQPEDKLLYLALLNTTVSMFFIECLGFGRGLGALDLSKNKFEKDFKILNPNLLNDNQKNRIIKAFQPLLNRNRLPLKQELVALDRIVFEKVIASIFGFELIYPIIKKALLELYTIRLSVKD